MTHIEALKFCAMLVASFPSAKIEPAAVRDGKPVPGTGTVAQYARAIEDLDAMAAAAAIDRLVATHRFPTLLPTVGEIREAVLSLSSGETRPGGDAWGDIMALLRPTKTRPARSIHSPPRESDCADPIVWRVICALTWSAICNAEESDPGPRSQAVRLYDSLAATARRADLSAALPAVRAFHELRAADDERKAIRAGDAVAKLLEAVTGQVTP